MTSRYGWSPRGARAYDSAPGAKGKHITAIGAMGVKGFISSVIGYGGVNKDGFYSFMKTQLFPHLKRGTSILLDNLSVHKDPRVLKLAESLGITLIFQPPYSPEYNPIELAWNSIKSVIRACRPRTLLDLEKVYLQACESIPVDHIRNWFRHCGF